jgi:hypothetical protein
MKGLLTFVPDGRYTVKSFATDEARNNVSAYGVFQAVRVHQPVRARPQTMSM